MTGAILYFFAGLCALSPAKVTNSYFTAEPVEVDGNPQEWSFRDRLLLTGEDENSENMVNIRSMWNNEFLYLCFEVSDSDVRAYQDSRDHPQLFLDDMVEVLFDPLNHKDSCWSRDNLVYHVNVLGSIKDDRGRDDCTSDALWNGNALIAVCIDGTLNDTSDTDRGYVVELAFPWEELGVVPLTGLRMGINYANGDNDGKGRQLFDWVGAWPMRSPYAYGDLVLKE